MDILRYPTAVNLARFGSRLERPDALYGLPREALHELAARTIVYSMHESWLDVGGLDDYHKANGVSTT